MNYWDGEPLEVGTVEQLLIDDHIVEDAWDLRRRVCQPLRHPIGPVLHADRPWEDGVVPWRVLYDGRDALYRMYYQSINAEAWQYQFKPELQSRWDMARHGPSYFTCTAHSPDGLHWEKPLLDVCPWRTHSQTNIVALGRTKSQAVDVALNPDPADEERRFIMAYRDRATLESIQGRFFAYSADGVHFTEDPANPIIAGASDGADVLCWDPPTKLWYYFIRPAMLPFDSANAPDPPIGNIKRRMCVVTSPDLQRWTFPRTVIYPDELDPTTMCLDQWLVFRHGSHFIALLSLMDENQEGVNITQIASSTDGFRWTRLPDRPVFMERGPEGSFDHGQTMITTGPVPMGDKWYFYYHGTARGQKASWHNVGAVGVAVLPKGRLVARFAGDRDGFMLTRELVVGGKHLDVNCELLTTGHAQAGQMIRVGIARRASGPNEHADAGYYEGFGLDCSDPVASTNLNMRMTWQGNDDLSALVGKPAYLRFYLRGAELYAMQLV